MKKHKLTANLLLLYQNISSNICGSVKITNWDNAVGSPF